MPNLSLTRAPQKKKILLLGRPELTILIYAQLPELTGVSALQPLQTGETDVTLLAGTTANSVLEGSFTKPFTTIVKVSK